ATFIQGAAWSATHLKRDAIKPAKERRTRAVKLARSAPSPTSIRVCVIPAPPGSAVARPAGRKFGCVKRRGEGTRRARNAQSELLHSADSGVSRITKRSSVSSVFGE